MKKNQIIGGLLMGVSAPHLLSLFVGMLRRLLVVAIVLFLVGNANARTFQNNSGKDVLIIGDSRYDVPSGESVSFSDFWWSAWDASGYPVADPFASDATITGYFTLNADFSLSDGASGGGSGGGGSSGGGSGDGNSGMAPLDLSTPATSIASYVILAAGAALTVLAALFGLKVILVSFKNVK